MTRPIHCNIGRLSAAFVGAAFLLSGLSARCQSKTSQQVRAITLEQCIRTALLQVLLRLRNNIRIASGKRIASGNGANGRLRQGHP